MPLALAILCTHIGHVKLLAHRPPTTYGAPRSVGQDVVAPLPSRAITPPCRNLHH